MWREGPEECGWRAFKAGMGTKHAPPQYVASGGGIKSEGGTEGGKESSVSLTALCFLSPMAAYGFVRVRRDPKVGDC